MKSNSESKNVHPLRNVWRWLKQYFSSWGTAVLAFLGAAALIWGVVESVIGFIESRVVAVISEPEFVRSLGQRMRPALVFDDAGVVIADLGAMTFLDRPPAFVLPTKEDKFAVKIIISPKKYLAAEPLVEAIDDSGIWVKATRASGLTWEVTVGSRGSGLIDPETVTTPSPYFPRYRLELVP